MNSKIFITLITGIAFLCLAIVSLNGISENMVACWSLATVVSAGILALSLAQSRGSEK